MDRKTGMLESLLVFVAMAVIFCLQIQFPKFAFIPPQLLVTIGTVALTAFGAIVRKQIKSGGM